MNEILEHLFGYFVHRAMLKAYEIYMYTDCITLQKMDNTLKLN